jgi:hypothetical protein
MPYHTFGIVGTLLHFIIYICHALSALALGIMALPLFTGECRHYLVFLSIIRSPCLVYF